MTSSSQSTISKVQASITKLHGGERELATKRDSYVLWILRKRHEEIGSSIIKKADHDAR